MLSKGELPVNKARLVRLVEGNYDMFMGNRGLFSTVCRGTNGLLSAVYYEGNNGLLSVACYGITACQVRLLSAVVSVRPGKRNSDVLRGMKEPMLLSGILPVNENGLLRKSVKGLGHLKGKKAC